MSAYRRAVQWWKWVGLAGLAGVAGTSAAVARNERERRAYTPEDVRERLHARLDGRASHDADDDEPSQAGHDESSPDSPPPTG
jgi:hypothetical protein